MALIWNIDWGPSVPETQCYYSTCHRRSSLAFYISCPMRCCYTMEFICPLHVDYYLSQAVEYREYGYVTGRMKSWP